MAEEVNKSSAPAPTTTTSSGTGIDPKLSALLSWLFTPITSIIFMILEDTKNDEFALFNAKESLYYGIAQFVLAFGTILVPIPVIGWLIGCVAGLGNLAMTVGRIIIAIKAYNGEKVVLPIIGDLASK